MRSTILSNSQFGTFYPSGKNLTSQIVQLDTVKELSQCKISLDRDRIFLLDSDGRLSCLNLKDKSGSTLTSCRIQAFHPDSWSSLSLSAVSPSSELLHIHFQNKKVCRVFNPCLNNLVSYQKNYLTDVILLAEAKVLVLVDGAKRIKSIKAEESDIFSSACMLGSNRFICLLLRSGDLQIRQSSTLQLRNRKTLPFLPKMKVAATNCGKTLAIYGKSNQLFLLNLNDNGEIINFRSTQLPFQYIIQLQFSYSNQLVILGDNRILYLLDYKKKQSSLKPIFNHDKKYIPTGFDISIDEKLIVLIAGRQIHMINLQKRLEKLTKAVKNLCVVFQEQQINENDLSNAKNIQYDDQQSEQSQKSEERNHQNLDLDHQAPPLQSVFAYKSEKAQEQNNLEKLLEEQDRIKQQLRVIRGQSS